jgi:DMSO/TMAO reductase YedYZ heme-binding membrane subunit
MPEPTPRARNDASRTALPVKVLRAGVLALYLLALAVPAIAFFRDRGGVSFLQGAHGRVVLQLLFPLFGLYAFTLVTAQILITTNLYWLNRLWPRVIGYHRAQGVVALLFALTHPALILIGYGLAVFLARTFTRPGLSGWLIPAYIGLTILLLTVVTALLAWSGKRISRWRSIHRLNYLAFALIWIHSWFIGTDTPTHLLRTVWLVYLALVAASVIGRYRRQRHARTRSANAAARTPARPSPRPSAR